jgi:uncharacterized membrane protein (UPF0127 family)
MPLFFRKAQILNQTRQVSLATEFALADSHWTRLRGLLGMPASDFRNGRALWITPCRGVHTLGMAFPIDVVYLDRDHQVVHLEVALRPWRFGPVRLEATSVLELPSQTVAQTRTEIGDKIEISQT